MIRLPALPEHAGAFVAVQRLDVQHLAPHVTRTGLAEIDFDLDRGLQSLDIMEDHGEGQQASGDGHRAEDDGGEGDGSRRGGGFFVAHSFA